MITSYAPGRAELLGNHTDYNAGYVLAIAVERGTTVKGEVRPDDLIKLTASDLSREVEVRLGEITPFKGDDSWANYVLGVVVQFQKRGLALGGFEASISTNLPIGAGLSSSAALEIGTALFLQKAFGAKPDKLETARIGQAAENQFVGVNCGLLDQIASLYGQEGAVTFIDCRTFEVRNVPAPAEGSFVIVNSNVKHALVGGEYNERRQDCEAAARSLGAPALRDVSRAQLEAGAAKMPARVLHRARHIVGENERVLAGIAALQRGDCAAFGALMFQSHESSQENFENSCAELDQLVAAARTAPGCFGARLSGGGFGGATINYVQTGQEEAFCAAIKTAYPAAEFLLTQAAGGAQ